jgi:hypothetical protein
MSESFEKRLAAAEKAYAAKHRTGPLLTRPAGSVVAYLGTGDAEGIAAAKNAGRIVIMPGDDPKAAFEAAKAAGAWVVVCHDPDPTDTNVWARPPASVID